MTSQLKQNFEERFHSCYSNSIEELFTWYKESEITDWGKQLLSIIKINLFYFHHYCLPPFSLYIPL